MSAERRSNLIYDATTMTGTLEDSQKYHALLSKEEQTTAIKMCLSFMEDKITYFKTGKINPSMYSGREIRRQALYEAAKARGCKRAEFFLG